MNIASSFTLLNMTSWCLYKENEIMNEEETIEPTEPAPILDEQQPLQPKPKVERVKKDLPKKKWRKQGLRKSTRNR